MKDYNEIIENLDRQEKTITNILSNYDRLSTIDILSFTLDLISESSNIIEEIYKKSSNKEGI